MYRHKNYGIVLKKIIADNTILLILSENNYQIVRISRYFYRDEVITMNGLY